MTQIKKLVALIREHHEDPDMYVTLATACDQLRDQFLVHSPDLDLDGDGTCDDEEEADDDDRDACDCDEEDDDEGCDAPDCPVQRRRRERARAIYNAVKPERAGKKGPPKAKGIKSVPGVIRAHKGRTAPLKKAPPVVSAEEKQSFIEAMKKGKNGKN